MRTLLFGVILGLLAVVHSTPLNTVTPIYAKAEDEVFREAVTDGFLVENFLGASSAPELPEMNTAVQASQQPTSDPKESDAIEGSGWEAAASLPFATTTVPHALSSATDDSGSGSSATQSPQSSATSAPNEAQSTGTPDHISASQTTDPAVSTSDLPSIQSSDSGSGDETTDKDVPTMSSGMTSDSNAETSTASSTSASIRRGVPKLFRGSEGSGEEPRLTVEVNETLITAVKEEKTLNSEPNKGKVQDIKPAPSKAGGTPGWMIIVGFIVGLAALVMLFVAIATRDKWNGPSRASQSVAKSNSANQQKELEMETFVHKDNPKENGHASEYTVIPLEDLSEKRSSY
ncbi:osteocalcin 2 [Cebidichthys violaceus]|uniref:osteocalcin 2 n=1 Tax=Cebidichthys violaceus TaxID=271503 RepID=UPI0035CA7FBA